VAKNGLAWGEYYGPDVVFWYRYGFCEGGQAENVEFIGITA